MGLRPELYIFIKKNYVKIDGKIGSYCYNLCL